VGFMTRPLPQNNNYGVWEEDEFGMIFPDQNIPHHETGLKSMVFEGEFPITGDESTAYMQAVINKCNYYIKRQQECHQSVDGIRDLTEILVGEMNHYDAQMLRIHNSSIHRWVLHQSDELITGEMEDPNRPSEVPYEEYIPENPAPPIDRPLSWQKSVHDIHVDNTNQSAGAQVDKSSVLNKGGDVTEAQRFDIPVSIKAVYI